MAKVVIDNRAADDWSETIEKKIALILASTLTSLAKVQVDFSETKLDSSKKKGFRCQVIGIHPSMKRYEVTIENPDGNSAIEGAIFRLKRSIVRRRQARRSPNQASRASNSTI